MSHDTDKLIRQLSLVAFLMAERRPLTARDVKQNVEGYSEMSDEAFARRFYSDRAELHALGVPLQSQRDEFTGEELYTLRSERYFLPPLELTDEELAALQTCLYLLEGKFAYAEPLRLALQNLTLGRPGLNEPRTPNAERVEVSDPDYSAEMPGRLSKLETAISKQRTVKFKYHSMARDVVRERTVDPYALLSDKGAWYVVGRDHERDSLRTFRVSRIQGEIRFATRRERDFRLPADFDADEHRLPPEWQIGALKSEARIELSGDTAWWVERVFGRHGRLEDHTFVTGYSELGPLAGWILRQDGRATPLGPDALRREVAAGLRRAACARGRVARAGRRGARDLARDARRPSCGPGLPGALRGAASPPGVPPSGVRRRARGVDSRAGDRRALHDSAGGPRGASLAAEPRQLRRRLLRRVRRAARRRGARRQGALRRHVPRPAAATPLEARAIRLALEVVGPMIAADAHSPLERVRRKLEETFGEFDLAQTAEPATGSAEEGLIATLTRGLRERRVVEIDYLKETEETPESHLIEPHEIERRRLPHWYVHTWDRTRDAERSFRLDRMRTARLTRERFSPREGFSHREGFARVARVWYSQQIARWQVERGATPLVDRSAVGESALGSPEWFVSWILSFRGEAVVLEPEDLRESVGARARELLKELGLTRVRASA